MWEKKSFKIRFKSRGSSTVSEEQARVLSLKDLLPNHSLLNFTFSLTSVGKLRIRKYHLPQTNPKLYLSFRYNSEITNMDRALLPWGWLCSQKNLVLQILLCEGSEIRQNSCLFFSLWTRTLLTLQKKKNVNSKTLLSALLAPLPFPSPWWSIMQVSRDGGK